MPTSPAAYLPGKAIVLSRLPAQDWFSVDEAAQHSGWGRTFIRQRCISGELPAQQCTGCDARHHGRNISYRIHVDDLVMFILKNSNGRYSEEKPFRDVATITRTWPEWMRKELVTFLSRSLPPSSPPEAGTTAVRSPGGERAAIS
ncbi:MAG: hypothetical protein ABIS50_11430 [Luteolibacter sp.]|uniref:hypothetical protein n=1 Tax=Luteolibacter sp. TaxID=1962973 RepID=UPI0032659A84